MTGGANRSTEVGVIGAGIHGASAAFHLASMGAKPVVFERAAAAGGPTGRSSAICRAYYTNPYLARVAHASLEMFRSFAGLTAGRDCGYHETGAVYLHPDGDAAALHAAAGYMNSIGTRIEMLDPAGLHREFPLFNVDAVGVAGWEPGAGYADPVATTAGLLARACELGATQRLYTRVAHLEARAGGGAKLTLEGGESVECNRLLIAAGPWTRMLAAQLGVELYLGKPFQEDELLTHLREMLALTP